MPFLSVETQTDDSYLSSSDFLLDSELDRPTGPGSLSHPPSKRSSLGAHAAADAAAGVDGDGKPGTGSPPESFSPIPPSASKWSVSNAEQLNIFYVPLEESPYLYCVGRGRGDDHDGYITYEYDYQRLLQDADKQNSKDVRSLWNEFSGGRGQPHRMLETILNFLAPDVNDKESSQLLEFFSNRAGRLMQDDMDEANDDGSSISSCHASSGSGSCESSPPRPTSTSATTTSTTTTSTTCTSTRPSTPRPTTGSDKPACDSSTTRVILPEIEKVPRGHDVVAETSDLPAAVLLLEKKSKELLNDLRHKVERRGVDLKMDRLTYRLLSKVNASDAGQHVPEELATFEIKKVVRRYFDVLIRVLCKYATDKPTSESSFVILFQSFASVFFSEFWSAIDKRTMTIYGQQVSSLPDLRFEMMNGDGTAVVSVVVVKKLAKEKEAAAPSCYQLRSGSQVGGGHKLIHDIDLPFNVRGKHAAELLVELSNSRLPKSDDGYEYIFGFIVQCTRVRLTCLKMLTRHRELLLKDQPQDLKDMRAEIHYTRGYDIFKKDDRKHLGFILLFMAFLCDRDVFLS